MNTAYNNKKKYKIKKVISMKQFISGFGDNFSEHMKKKLMELEIRCVLTRKEDDYRLDFKHVEHTRYDCLNNTDNNSDAYQKEYTYGQFVVIDNTLYFSEHCAESDEVMEAPIVSTIYNSLSNEDIISDSGVYAKKIDDSNIDYVIDTILAVFPQVTQDYINIISRYL